MVDHQQRLPARERLTQRAQPLTGRADLRPRGVEPLEKLQLEGDQVGPLADRDPEDPVREAGRNLLLSRERGREHALPDPALTVKPGRARVAADPQRTRPVREQRLLEPREVLSSRHIARRRWRHPLEAAGRGRSREPLRLGRERCDDGTSRLDSLVD
jgi:hypothetical protein